MSPPAVSIIVLNRNGAAILDALLASFERVNRYPNYDIILVDHGSSDGSLAVAEKWAARLPLTLVRCSRNHSFAYSCNRAAERARGEYLMLLNNDVVLSEDLIGRLVANAARHRSMVGCKLLSWPEENHAASVLHIGVRFRWSLRRGFPIPYDAAPRAGDRAIATLPSQFLAVTAALCVCRRDDYLAEGGLCEAYVYGFEDADLCLKFALGRGRLNLSRNDVAAWHRQGSTRLKKDPVALRAGREKDNAELLRRRFGYALRRTLLPLLFSDDGSRWGRRAHVRVVAGIGNQRIAAWSRRLAADPGWTIDHRPRYQLKGVDLLIVADPRFRPERARHRHPMMGAIAWVMDRPETWCEQDFTIYDLVLAADAALAAAVTARGAVAIILDPEAGAERFRQILLDYLSARFRIAIKRTASSDPAFTLALAAALRQAGHFVRIDPPPDWHALDTMRDDVAILLPGEPAGSPPSGQIALACGDAGAGAVVDARLALADPAPLAAAILDAVARLHPARLRGPRDQPLLERPPFPDRIVAGWD